MHPLFRMLVALSFILSPLLSGTVAGQTKPHIVIFISDDHGQLDSTPYGAKDVKTPHMQRLAKAGMTFTQAFAASPACAPSRASILTGLMPNRHGAMVNHARPKDEVRKWPAFLRMLGYLTAAFGKVAHYGQDKLYGFDHYQRVHDPKTVATFLESHDVKKPLCLFVGTHSPHVPWPKEAAYDPAEVQLPASHVDTKETREMRARYYTAVSKADSELGEIIDLVRAKLGENVLFIYKSDHGAQWPFGKWNLYDAGIRVPFLAAWPGVIRPASRSDAMISLADLLPTMIEIAGGKAPADLDGKSFADVLRGKKTSHRETIFTTHSRDGDMNVYPTRAVRTRDWAYIRNLDPKATHTTHIDKAMPVDGLYYWSSWVEKAKSDPAAAKIVERYHQRPAEELYDLKNDPLQLRNVAADRANAERLGQLRAQLDAWMMQQGDEGLKTEKNQTLPGKAGTQASATEIADDFSAFKPDSGVAVRQQGTRLRINWPIADGEHGELLLDLRAGQPLIEAIGIAKAAGAQATPLVRKVNPVTLLTVGSRDLSKQGWNVFFDNPPRRPHETFLAVLAAKKVAVRSQGRRTTVALDGLSAGPFKGELHFTVYPNCRLVHVTAVVSTEKDACAILYDAGLTSPTPDWKTVAWMDTDDKLQRVPATSQTTAAAVAVRNRTIVAEGANGSIALFPPPHRFIYPLDFTDNFKLVWHGKGFQKQVNDWGIGVRQPPQGDNRWVPWVNAPPKTRQHLDIFYLLSKGQAAQALDEVRRFTNGDRFRKLDGYKTFTHHYHIEHTFNFLREQRKQKTDEVPIGLESPPFVKTFKAHGVDIVQLAEFHTEHTPELNAERLNLLRTMHRECRRLSDEGFLLLPGEEPNVYLGGHWISMFPRPVYWHLHPKPGTPFEQKIPGFGTVYAVQNAQDVLRLMDKENGLMWTAHPRTKGSYGFPDRYREEKFYLSPHFLGAGWKHMPADYSQPRLGARALDLFDDMGNWGQHKYLLGEVDVFKILPTHELYGHLNINYLKLDKIPRFDDGWQPVLDALRNGRFFVTTGEIVMPEFSAGGRESGQTLRLADGRTAEVRARLDWTFPPAFAEIIWGDGNKVHRQRVDLSDGEAFSGRAIRIPMDLKGAKWVRLEAWDIAANGVFSQPVWVE